MTGTMVAAGLPTIQMFWHGTPLSLMERLSIESFLANGHPVDLYVYEDPGAVPDGARLQDAERILPRSLMFRHRHTGSLAAFADWFRYRLLLEKGGIWADADVVCLKPFAFDAPVVFGRADENYINNAILGLPAGHPLAEWMAAICESPNRPLPYDGLQARLRKWKRRLLYGDQREKLKWSELGPKGLTPAADYLGYSGYARRERDFYPVRCQEWQVLFEHGPRSRALSFDDCYCVHLWNNMTSQQPDFDKEGRFHVDSPFARLCQRYLGDETSAP